MTLTATFEKLTPTAAKKLLANNYGNRPLDDERVSYYTKEIQNGYWRLNGDSIRLSKEGALLDGQHRLHAIIKAGTPISTLVVRGLDKDIFSTIDVGKHRTVWEILKLQGYQYTTFLSGATKLIIFIKESEEKINLNQHYKTRISHSHVLDFLKKNNDLPEIVKYFVTTFPKARDFMGRGGGAALYYLFLKQNEKQANEFFRDLDTGANLSVNSVIYQAREKLIALRHSPTLRVNIAFKIAIALTAWNLIRDGYHDARLIVDEKLIFDRIK